MKWATRAGIHVDRAASAWLIATHVDSDAVFTYVDDIADVPNDATPFDMFGCDLGHHGDDVTFETILRRNDIVDPVLWQIAQIVHEADLEDDLFDAPEAMGLDLVVRAIQNNHDDEETRKLTGTIFSSIEHYLREQSIRPGF